MLAPVLPTVVAIIIAVLVDRYIELIPGGALLVRFRSSVWLNAYLNKVLDLLQKYNLNASYANILALVVPLLLLMALLKLLFVMIFGIIGSVLLTAGLLFYFLGNNEPEQHASEFIVAHERSFAILFWFAILNIWGALLYWFLVICKQTQVMQEEKNSPLVETIKRIHAFAAWIPARITGFVFALVGSFTGGFSSWVDCVKQVNMPSSQVLDECGQASVDANIAGDDLHLVTRAYIAWVVLSILIVWFI